MKRMTAVAILLTVAACTSSSTSNSGSSGGTNGNGNGSEAPDGGDSNGTTNPTGTTTQKIGTVSLSQSTFHAGPTTITSYTAVATFAEATGTSTTTTTGGTDPCKRSTEGDCSVLACDTSSLSGSDAGTVAVDGGGPTKTPTAGDITITGAKTITLSPGDNGTYSPKTEQVALWTDGGQVAVDAKGADVPAFQKSLAAPSPVTLTAPAWPSTPGAAVPIDRSQDLAVTWSNGGAGDVQVTLTSAAGTKTGLITCKFAASGGSGTITKAALGNLVATATGTINISASSSDTVTAGDWQVTVSALAPATTSSGAAASGIANIQ
jgi:hypothetical protein